MQQTANKDCSMPVVGQSYEVRVFLANLGVIWEHVSR